MMRALILFIWITLGALSGATSALAHASLIEVAPADGSTLEASPSTIRLRFSEPIKLLELKLLLADGQVLDHIPAAVKEHLVEAELTERLPNGTHVLGFRVVSADGHPINGTVSYSVGQPSTRPSDLASVSGVVQGAIWLTRLIAYAGLFIGVGGVFFLSWLRPGTLPPTPVYMWLAGAGLLGSVLNLGLQGLDALGLSLFQLGALRVWNVAVSTSLGPSTAGAVSAALFAIAAHAAGNEITRRVLSLLALLALSVSFTLTGHAGTASPQWLTCSAIFVHMVGVTYWIGALLPLLGLLRDRTRLAPALQQFSIFAVPAVLAIVASGVILAVIQVGSFSGLLRTGYGNLLTIKLFVVGCLLAVAAANRTLFSPSLNPLARTPLGLILLARVAEVGGRLSIVAMRRATPVPATHADSAISFNSGLLASAGAFGGRLAIAALKLSQAPSAHSKDASARGLAYTIRLELALACVVFAMAAGWRFTPPPRAHQSGLVASSPRSEEILLAGDGAFAKVTLLPDGPSHRRATIKLSAADASPLNAEAVTLAMSQPSLGLGPLQRTASKTGANTWTIDDLVPPANASWQVAVEVLVNDFEKKTLKEAQLTGALVPPEGRHGHHSTESFQPSTGPSHGASGRVLYYRNPMGLPDVSPMPKKDSMGMDYVPVYESEGAEAAGVHIAPGRLQQWGVRSEQVQWRANPSVIHAPGIVEQDERLVSVVAVRSEAWVEKVESVTTGDRVAQGQALMSVYSPDISAAAAQYLSNIGNEGARRRLENLAVPPDVLAEIERTRAVPMKITWRAPRDGIILERRVSDGMRAAPGEVLFRIVDQSVVWIVADVPERDLARIAPGQPVSVTLRSRPGHTHRGSVALIYPSLNLQSRTGRVRIELPNPIGELRPAMYADVQISTGRPEPSITVPESAVIETGRQQMVIIDRGQGRFEPREVKVGVRGSGTAEILGGVKREDKVVVSANFLIDSESNLKAAVRTLASATPPN